MSPRSPILTRAQAALFREASEAFNRHAPAIVAAAKEAGFDDVRVMTLLAAPFVDVVRHCVAGSLKKGARDGDLDTLTRLVLAEAETAFAAADRLQAEQAVRQ